MLETLIPHFLDFLFSVFRLSVWLILLIAIFVPLERLFALHPEKFFRKQVGVDLAWYFINSIVPAAVIAFPLAAISYALQGLDPLGFYSFVAGFPTWLSLLLLFVVNDIGSYWGHRLSHQIPFLWRFHALHHSPEHMDWLVNTRAHPIDMVVTRLSGLIPVYLLGLGQTMEHGGVSLGVTIVMISGIVWSFFIHSNIRARLGPLEWLISTPAFHHWHHTNDEHRDRNFAAVFPWIDRLFGTAWLPKHWPSVYGIDGKTSTKLSGQFTEPFKRTWEKTFKRKPKQVRPADQNAQPIRDQSAEEIPNSPFQRGL